MLPDESRCRMMIAVACRCFRMIQRTPYACWWFQMPTDDFRFLQMIQDESKSFQMSPDVSRWLQMPWDAAQMIPDDSAWFQMTPGASSKWFRQVASGFVHQRTSKEYCVELDAIINENIFKPIFSWSYSIEFFEKGASNQKWSAKAGSRRLEALGPLAN